MSQDTIVVAKPAGTVEFNVQDLPGRPEQEVLKSVSYTPANANSDYFSVSTLSMDSLSDVFAALDAIWWHELGFAELTHNGQRFVYLGANPQRLAGWDGLIKDSLIKPYLEKATLEEPHFQFNGEIWQAPLKKEEDGTFSVRLFSPAAGWFAVRKTVTGKQVRMPKKSKYGKFNQTLRAAYFAAIAGGAKVTVDVTTRWNTNDAGERVLKTAVQDYAQKIQEWLSLPREDALAQIRKEREQSFANAVLDQKAQATLDKPVDASHDPKTKKEASTVVLVNGEKVALKDVPTGEYQAFAGTRSVARYLAVTPLTKGRLLNLANQYGSTLELKS